MRAFFYGSLWLTLLLVAMPGYFCSAASPLEEAAIMAKLFYLQTPPPLAQQNAPFPFNYPLSIPRSKMAAGKKPSIATGTNTPLPYSGLSSMPTVSAVYAADLTSAEQALALGMPHLAEEALTALLNRGERFNAALLARIQLDLVTALLAQSKWELAKEQMAIIAEPYRKSAYYLRLALVAHHDGDKLAVQDALAHCVLADLAVADVAWYYYLQAEQARDRGDDEAENAALAKATTTATTFPQRQVLIANQFLRQWQQQGSHLELAQSLMAKINTHRGDKAAVTPLVLQYAAIMTELGRQDEALALLQKHLKELSSHKPDAGARVRLVFASLAAKEHPLLAIQALQEVFANVSPDLQRLAFYQLVDLLKGDPEVAKKIYRFFDQLIDQGMAVNSPLDELLYTRAVHSLEQQNSLAADADLARLIQLFPASQWRREALCLRAYSASHRDPPQWRTAAHFFEQAREDSPPGAERDRLDMAIADCYFLNRDYSSAAGFYLNVLEQGQTFDCRGTALFQLVLAEINNNNLSGAEQYLDTYMTRPGVDAASRWAAEWNLALALYRSGEGGGVKAYVRISNQLQKERQALPPDLLLRFMWLEAKLAMDLKFTEQASRVASDIIRAVNDFSPTVLNAHFKDEILSHALLLQGQAYLELAKESEALVVFEQLHQAYPQTQPAVLSYIALAHFYAQQNRQVDAQRTWIKLADKYPDDDAVPMALYEAALNAQRRGIAVAYEEALVILERLATAYSEHELCFVARLLQGDLLRNLNNFPAARQVYENLLHQCPDHPEIARASLALGNTLCGLASHDPDQLEQAIILFERLFERPQLAAALHSEAGYLWGWALIQQQKESAAKHVLWQTIHTGLQQQDTGLLGPAARYWLARAMFELGTLLEQQGDVIDARNAFQLIIDYSMPGAAEAHRKVLALSSA